jgi:hypothetical protein
MVVYVASSISTVAEQLHIMCSVTVVLQLCQQYFSQGGGHSPQLHDLPPGADGFLCVAEESDCTSVFSTL